MGSGQSNQRAAKGYTDGHLASDAPDEDSSENKIDLSPTQRYELWGLGRGVDITKEAPWLEKTAFQVRRVDKKVIVETDEGGLLRGYDELVSHNTTIHSEVRAGITVPHTPLSIGLDTEYSRNNFSSRQVVGTRVKNRTISFRVDFDDVPKLRIKDVKEVKKAIIEANKTNRQISQEDTDNDESDGGGKADNESSIQHPIGFFNGEPFEKRLRKWLIECLKHRGVDLKENEFYDRIYRDCTDPNKDILEIEADILHFFNHFGVTHYVSAIVLGGLEYSVFTEKEYERKVTMGGKASISAHSYGGLESSAKQSHYSKLLMKSSVRKQIGKIENDKVSRRNEAVIGYEIRPISSLVKNPYLQQALKAGIEKYAEKKTSTGGPYLITTCGDPTMYLAVDRKSKQLIATFNRDKADEFSVKILNESSSHHELEFTLTSTMTKRSPTKPKEGVASQTQAASKERALLPLEYCMETRVNPLTGKSLRTQPPRMRVNPRYKHTRVILKKRTNHRISCDTKEWIKGRDAYYIRCLHRFHSGYLCVKKRVGPANQRANGEQPLLQADDGQVTPTPQDNQQVTAAPQEGQQVTPTPQDGQQATPNNRYKVCIKSSIESHSDDSEVFMLFRLQPAE